MAIFTISCAYTEWSRAYEILDIHKREPPPKDILEDVTAAGGNLLTRTRENYKKSSSRDERLGDGAELDASSDDVLQTPRGDRMDVDDPNSATGRRSMSRHIMLAVLLPSRSVLTLN